MRWDESKHSRDKKGRFTFSDYKNMSIEELKEIALSDNSKVNIVESGAVSGASSGAYNDSNDADGEKRKAHAESYYNSIRNSDKKAIISSISSNTKIDEVLVEKMFEHLFVNKYDLEEGYKTFAPDYDIAQSIQRLREGNNIQEHDIILIKHEAMEYDIMKKYGLTYHRAHEIVAQQYNYAESLKKWKMKKGE